MIKNLPAQPGLYVLTKFLFLIFFISIIHEAHSLQYCKEGRNLNFGSCFLPCPLDVDWTVLGDCALNSFLGLNTTTPSSCNASSFDRGLPNVTDENPFVLTVSSDPQLSRAFGNNRAIFRAKYYNRRLVQAMNTWNFTRSWPEYMGGGSILEPEGVVVVGDVTEFFQNDPVAREVDRFRYFYDPSYPSNDDDVVRLRRTYVGYGNHDYANNVNDCKGMGLDSNYCAEQAVSIMRSTLGLDCASSHFALFPKAEITSYDHGSMAYTWDVRGYHFVMLHYNPYYEAQLTTTAVTSSIAWLRAELARAGQMGRKTVLYIHDVYEYRDLSSDYTFLSLLVNASVVAIFRGHTHDRPWGYAGTIGPAPVFNAGASWNEVFLSSEFARAYFRVGVVRVAGSGDPYWSGGHVFNVARNAKGYWRATLSTGRPTSWMEDAVKIVNTDTGRCVAPTDDGDLQEEPCGDGASDSNKEPKAILHEGCGPSGRSWHVRVGMYVSIPAGSSGDEITYSAITVPTGLLVTLYEFTGFGGRSLVLNASQAAIVARCLSAQGFADTTSSLVIEDHRLRQYWLPSISTSTYELRSLLSPSLCWSAPASRSPSDSAQALSLAPCSGSDVSQDFEAHRYQSSPPGLYTLRPSGLALCMRPRTLPLADDLTPSPSPFPSTSDAASDSDLAGGASNDTQAALVLGACSAAEVSGSTAPPPSSVYEFIGGRLARTWPIVDQNKPAGAVRTKPGCFPADARVFEHTHGWMTMDALRVGHRVRVAPSLHSPAASDTQFERVYWIPHSDSVLVAAFVRVSTASGHALVVTANHYVPVTADGKSTLLLRARRVHVGMQLLVQLGPGSLVPSAITSVTTVLRRGFFAPYTASGFLLVDRVLASSHSLSLPWDPPTLAYAPPPAPSTQPSAHPPNSTFSTPHSHPQLPSHTESDLSSDSNFDSGHHFGDPAFGSGSGSPWWVFEWLDWATDCLPLPSTMQLLLSPLRWLHRCSPASP